MTKRICFIRQSAYPYELSVRREVETMCRAGYETHIICLSAKNHKLEEIIDGVHVHRMPLVRKKTSIARYVYDYLAFFLLASLKLTGIHLKRRFDVVQINTMPDFLVFSAFIPKLMGAKVVAMMQEPVPELWQTKHNARPPRILQMAEQAALRYVDASLTVTQQLKDTYVRRGADPAKIAVILNVPETRFLGLDQASNDLVVKDSDHFTLISHGAIEKRYGHDTMLQAIALLQTEIPNVRLRILGEGSYVDEFLAQRSHLGLEEYVQFLGWVSHAEMIQELRAADVGIVAQRSSPYSNLVHTNKMYEFIAFGKPVLASRLESVAVYFDENSLYFFEPSDAESLAQGILDLYRRPAKREALVENALKLYEQYKWEKQKDIYLSVYRELLRIGSAL